MMAAIWNPVLYFPSSSAPMTIPFSDKIARSPVTEISLPMMTKVIHAGTRPRGISIMSAAEINSLSAKGSRNFPSADSRPYRRARNPSSKSVIEAAEKMRAAIKAHTLPGEKRSRINTGMHAIRNRVKLLGALKNRPSEVPARCNVAFISMPSTSWVSTSRNST